VASQRHAAASATPGKRVFAKQQFDAASILPQVRREIVQMKFSPAPFVARAVLNRVDDADRRKKTNVQNGQTKYNYFGPAWKIMVLYLRNLNLLYRTVNASSRSTSSRRQCLLNLKIQCVDATVDRFLS
jgi:hypothetical protein